MSAPVQALRDRRLTRPPPAMVAALSAGAVALVTVVGSIAARAGVHQGSVAERELPPGVVVLCLGGLLAGPAAAWVVRETHPQAALGLAVATVAVALPVVGGWPWPPAVVGSAALAAAPLAVPGLAGVALRWRGGRGGTVLRATWAVAAVATGLHLLGYDPFADPSCSRTCDAVPAVLGGLVPTPAVVVASSALVAAGAGLAIMAVLTRADAPRVVGQAVGFALAALGAAAVLRASGWGGAETAGRVVVLAPLAVAVVAVAVSAVAVRTARTRTAVDTLLQELADPRRTDGPGLGRLRDVHFAVPDEQRWVDRAGAVVTAPAAGTQTVVLRDGAGEAVRLLLPPRTDPAEVLAGLTPVRRLALTNARLTAVARARLRDLQESQRRAVARGDAERTRIERDVHDGAQQRLVSAMFHLSLAQAHVEPAQRATLSRAQQEVRLTLARLRRTTQGPFPTVLADQGLLAAVEDLVWDADVPVAFETDGDLRVADDVGRAAYAVVASALAGLERTAPGAAARVALRREDGVLRIGVEVSPAPPAEPDVTEVTDRVGAVGGTYERSRCPGSMTVSAVVPCAS